MSTNPYAAPTAEVADVLVQGDESNFIAEGQRVAAGRGLSWIAEAWTLFREQPLMWLLQFGAAFLLAVVVSLIPIVGQIALSLFMPVLIAGIVYGAHQLNQGEPLTFGKLFAGFSLRFVPLLLLGVISLVGTFGALLVGFGLGGAGFGVLTGAGADVGAGFFAVLMGTLIALALMVPLYMALWFASSLVIINDYAVTQAIKTSFAACLKNIVPFLVYGVLMFILLFVASIPFGLGLIIAIPLAGLATYTSYRDVFYQE